MHKKKNINDKFYDDNNKNYAILLEADHNGWKLAKKKTYFLQEN